MSGPGAGTVLAAPEPGTGDLVGGRYRIESELGYGGMAHVYRARDERLQRDVAIKVFRAGMTEAVDPQRTTREVHILASLSHPAVVSVLDASDDPLNGAYIVMELVDGDDLGATLRTGPLQPEQARRIAGDVAAALAALHARSIVHRDVKPANILVLSPAAAATGGIAAKLTDFGIAQLIDGTRITAPEQIIGTAAFLSPEQVRSEPVGPPSDIYSLGLVLLECLTGQRVFPGTGAETAMARLVRQPVIPAIASAGLADLLRRMTALDPAARPTADDVATQLREQLVGGMVAGEDARTAQTPAIPMTAVAAASLPLATGPVRATGAVPTGSVARTGGFAATPPDEAGAGTDLARRHRRMGVLSGVLGGFAALAAAAAALVALTPSIGATTAPVQQQQGSSAPTASVSAPAATRTSGSGSSTGTHRSAGSSTSSSPRASARTTPTASSSAGASTGAASPAAPQPSGGTSGGTASSGAPSSGPSGAPGSVRPSSGSSDAPSASDSSSPSDSAPSSPSSAPTSTSSDAPASSSSSSAAVLQLPGDDG